MGERSLASELVGAIPGVRLLGGVLPEKQAARTFLGRWVRRGIMASFGVGFSVPALLAHQPDHDRQGFPKRRLHS